MAFIADLDSEGKYNDHIGSIWKKHESLQGAIGRVLAPGVPGETTWHLAPGHQQTSH
jgi:hypothetical protein